VPGITTTTCLPEPGSWSSEPYTLRPARAVDPGDASYAMVESSFLEAAARPDRPGNVPGIMFLQSDPLARDSQTRHPDDGVRPT